MFISPAYAQGVGGSSDFMLQLLPILLMFVIFYFLLLRPQQQKMKAHRQMLENLKRGDVIVTSGGVIGKITKVFEDRGELEVEISPDTKVRIVRGMVSEVRGKNEPV